MQYMYLSLGIRDRVKASLIAVYLITFMKHCKSGEMQYIVICLSSYCKSMMPNIRYRPWNIYWFKYHNWRETQYKLLDKWEKMFVYLATFGQVYSTFFVCTQWKRRRNLSRKNYCYTAYAHMLGCLKFLFGVFHTHQWIVLTEN